MAVTESQGYDGTLYEGGFARMARYQGLGLPAVPSLTDLAVTAAGGDRSVTVAAGEAYGHNVLDTVTSTTVGPMPSVVSGSEWNSVVLRRDWTANTSTVTYVPGGPSQAVAADVEDEPGTTADDVLALVRIQQGQTAPQQFIDMREFLTGGGLRRFGSVDARNYRWPTPIAGDKAYVNGVGVTEYTGSAWRLANDSGWVTIPLASGMSSRSGPPAARRIGSVVYLRGSIRRTNNADIGSAVVLGTVPAGYRPVGVEAELPVATAPKVAGSAALLSIGTNGVLTPYLHVAVSFVSLTGISYLID